MWYYTKALEEEGFEIVGVPDPDAALHELSCDPRGFALIIVDVKMPPGKLFADDDTVDGLRTGVFLAERLAERYANVPVVILTSVHPDVIRQRLQGKTNVRRILGKTDCPPFDLVDEVQRVIESCGHAPTV
jgi:DNA-binding NarL/FixJ family response regulator